MSKITDGNQLYMEFMLNRISRDVFLNRLAELPEIERRKVLSIRNMQIFESLLPVSVATASP